MNPSTVLRERSDGTTPRVTAMELFFDLVYMFAITQLSEFLKFGAGVPITRGGPSVVRLLMRTLEPLLHVS